MHKYDEIIIEVRKIHDINNNTYKIYDLMKANKVLNTKTSISTLETLEEALECYPGAIVVDNTK